MTSSSDAIQDSNAQPSASLDALRAKIDALDHELLALLGRRNALITEIARFKRGHRVPIRDFQRERHIVTDRRAKGGTLGLSGDLVESLFRLILWGSRDRQAALKVEVPPDIDPKSVAVIGGRGAMGGCIAQLFRDLGHRVTVADLDTDLKPVDAAANADAVVISVPIDQTIEVIRTVGPRVRAGGLMMDVTSVKQGPVAAMLEATEAEVVGTHPLFGPSVHSLQGQRVVLCRARGAKWFDWLERMFRARGLVTKEATPEQHDRSMAVVQVLVHFATEVMGRTLSKLGVSLDETLSFTSPIYLMELLMTARHFAQSPGLYGAIQMSNPAGGEVTEAFVRAAGELRDVVDRGDADAFARMFHDVQAYFGPFTDQAMEQSSFLIDRLVERA